MRLPDLEPGHVHCAIFALRSCATSVSQWASQIQSAFEVAGRIVSSTAAFDAVYCCESAGSHLEVSLSVQFLPRGGSKLCEQCTGSCGRLRDDVPSGQDLMWTGQPMVCRTGYCMPADAPIELSHACSGDWDSLEMEEPEEEEQLDMDEGLGLRRGRRLLVLVCTGSLHVHLAIFCLGNTSNLQQSSTFKACVPV